MGGMSSLGMAALIEIGDQLGLSVMTYTRLAGGTENASYVVHTKQGRFIFTVLKRRSVSSAVDYTAYLSALEESGLPVPRLRARRDGQGYVATCGDHPVIATEFVDGRCGKLLSPHRLYRLGQALATLHSSQVACALSPTIRLTDEDCRGLTRCADQRFASWLLGRYEQVQGVLSVDYPSVPTHGDLWRDNVIVTLNDGLILIDWDDGACDLAPLDVGIAILGSCATRTVDVARVDQLLSGYLSTRQLEGDTRFLAQASVYAGLVVAYRRYQRSRQHGKGARSHLEIQVLVESLIEICTQQGVWP